MFSFNLIEEKWLPCVWEKGTLEKLSLREVLTNASKIKELVGDSPPVTIALHRLLLAILHRALNAPQTYEEWEDFWQAKSWNANGKLEKYLNDWKYRFDLFDEKRPFYQVSSIEDKIQDGAIIQLYFQAKANATLFDHSTTSIPTAITPAEAARLEIANKETMMPFWKHPKKGWLSVNFNENKALWRDSISILQTVQGKTSKPKIFDWLSQLSNEDILKQQTVLPIDFFGLTHHPSNVAKLLFWSQEKFYIPISLVDNKELLSKIELAIGFAEDIGGQVLRFALKTLADDLETDLKNFSGLSIYWSGLERQFKKFLVDLPDKENEALENWFRFTDSLAKNAFKQTANSLSGSAKEQKAVVEAENTFYSSRKKLINKNSEYKELLPNYKTKGGEE